MIGAEEAEEMDADLKVLQGRLPSGVDPAAASLVLNPLVLPRPGFGDAEAEEEARGGGADGAAPDGVEDTLLFALPVVGPWSALSSAKWVVKLLPGSGKRGKVGREAIGQLFTACSSSGSEREASLIRRVSDSVLNQAMVGDVRLADGGPKRGGGGRGRGGKGRRGRGRGSKPKRKKGER